MIPRSNRIHFSVAFPTLPSSLRELWSMLASFLLDEKKLPRTFEMSQMWGHDPDLQSESCLTLNDHEIACLIETRKLHGFKVYSGSGSSEIDFWMSPRPYNIPVKLGCTVGAKAKAPDDWTMLIQRIMGEFETIGSWQWARLYSFWQSDTHADDRYQRRWGMRPPGGRLWTEPKAHALDSETLRIDISKNPGRQKALTSEVSFLPTAEMWLGPHFWQYAKCTKEEVLAADFFIEKRDTPHFLYLKSWPTAFTRPDGEQGRQQQRLWKLFFHEDCEWPPGSGTICDEPMYGPPELMPGYVPPAK